MMLTSAEKMAPTMMPESMSATGGVSPSLRAME